MVVYITTELRNKNGKSRSAAVSSNRGGNEKKKEGFILEIKFKFYYSSRIRYIKDYVINIVKLQWCQAFSCE